MSKDSFQKQLKVYGNVKLKELSSELETIMKAKCKSSTITKSIRTEHGSNREVVGIDQGIVERISGKDFSEAYVKGARPHTIKAKNAPYLVFKGRSGIVRTKQVSHPGSPSHPFIEESISELMGRYPNNIKKK